MIQYVRSGRSDWDRDTGAWGRRCVFVYMGVNRYEYCTRANILSAVIPLVLGPHSEQQAHAQKWT